MTRSGEKRRRGARRIWKKSGPRSERMTIGQTKKKIDDAFREFLRKRANVCGQRARTARVLWQFSTRPAKDTKRDCQWPFWRFLRWMDLPETGAPGEGEFRDYLALANDGQSTRELVALGFSRRNDFDQFVSR